MALSPPGRLLHLCPQNILLHLPFRTHLEMVVSRFARGTGHHQHWAVGRTLVQCKYCPVRACPGYVEAHREEMRELMLRACDREPSPENASRSEYAARGPSLRSVVTCPGPALPASCGKHCRSHSARSPHRYIPHRHISAPTPAYPTPAYLGSHTGISHTGISRLPHRHIPASCPCSQLTHQFAAGSGHRTSVNAQIFMSSDCVHLSVTYGAFLPISRKVVTLFRYLCLVAPLSLPCRPASTSPPGAPCTSRRRRTGRYCSKILRAAIKKKKNQAVRLMGRSGAGLRAHRNALSATDILPAVRCQVAVNGWRRGGRSAAVLHTGIIIGP